MKPEITLRALLDVQKALDTRFAEPRRRYARRLCDLSYANPYDGPDPAVRAILRDVLDQDHPLQFQYTPYGGRPPARRAAALELAEAHGLPYEWTDVVLTPGAMAALAITFHCLRETDAPRRSDVLVIIPCWHDYPTYLRAVGLNAVPCPMTRPDYTIDCDRVRDRLRDGQVAAVLLSQPSNPTGVLFDEDNLRDLAAALSETERPPLLISDEVHRDFVLPPARMVSPAAFYDRTVVVYSFGKRLSLQGQRVGYAAVSPNHPERSAVIDALRDACRYTGICTPTALMQHALPKLIRLAPDTERYRRRRERLIEALERNGHPVAPGQHTYFVYARAPIAHDMEFVETLADQGLLALPGSLFHDLHDPGHIRFSVTATDEMVDGACAILDRLGASGARAS